MFHHLLLWCVVAIASTGWVVMPLRQTRKRFVLTLMIVFAAGAMANPVAHAIARGAYVATVYATSTFEGPAQCPQSTEERPVEWTGAFPHHPIAAESEAVFSRKENPDAPYNWQN